VQRRRIDAGARRRPWAGEALLTFAPGSAPGFDRDTLELLSSSYEIDIETSRPDGGTRSTTIWVVVVDGRVFVRSVRGDRGHWFQAALDDPESIVLLVDRRAIPTGAQLATDETSIERCSAGLRAKYARDPSLRSMLRPQVLETTLLLEPR
jgi:hypothetical protein